jgi:catechol 2,3-dioxygenase-like lactoylglutathione lyase family enzyme
VIDHVNFQMPEPVAHECAAFYELLGFARVEPPTALAGRALWLSGRGALIHLQFGGTDGTDISELAQPGVGHVGIVVPDYAAVTASLRAAGVESEPRSEHWGSPRCYVRDPAGNRLELMEFAPPRE